VLVVAATPTSDRRRFSVAHELAHLVLHHIPQAPPHALEQQADVFAEAFLLPAAAMREALVPPSPSPPSPTSRSAGECRSRP
jgi:Zn-dependent peptidase ImmA (M78 family)